MMSSYGKVLRVFALLCLTAVAASTSGGPEEKREDRGGQTDESYEEGGKEVHCYCNLSDCVRTGYMCKSSLGCFSDLNADMNVDLANHGCLDMESQDKCGNVPGVPPLHQPSLLICCYEDMCNHVDSPEARMKYNESVYAVAAVIAAGSEKVVNQDSYKAQEVWFKVATIAVPICGALILLILIALAVRMLRSDSLDETVLGAKFRSKHGFPVMNGPIQPTHNLTGNGSDKKLPLLFQQNDTKIRPALQEKNLANAKLNSLPPESAFIDFEKRTDPSECNFFRGGVTSPLLASELPDKLDYKRPQVWPDNNV